MKNVFKLKKQRSLQFLNICNRDPHNHAYPKVSIIENVSRRRHLLRKLRQPLWGSYRNRWLFSWQPMIMLFGVKKYDFDFSLSIRKHSLTLNFIHWPYNISFCYRCWGTGRISSCISLLIFAVLCLEVFMLAKTGFVSFSEPLPIVHRNKQIVFFLIFRELSTGAVLLSNSYGFCFSWIIYHLQQNFCQPTNQKHRQSFFLDTLIENLQKNQQSFL